jgi:molecular chaperone GrpE
MPPDKKRRGIPIKFLDSEQENDSANGQEVTESVASPGDEDYEDETGQMTSDYDQELEDAKEIELEDRRARDSSSTGGSLPKADELGGPALAELIATRSELKRVEGEVNELKDRLARRQADFENYRKRMDRERSETFNRVSADVAEKLLPVLDNLKRALDTEASVEASESDEFRHFLSGVDLIYKQLEGVLDALGVKPVLAVGEQFDPHVHEAVVTEPTEDYQPETVMQELVRGYRLGDKLIRPALVKVAVKK